ncbi:ketosteroid isomerase-like protein [Pedobacter sp. UYP30]|uniref:nuclear transport factor 2 family protein n=1 Tax=Pedobacter sp. UYP30 TaxID=1756400 RepID=UPI00339ADD55
MKIFLISSIALLFAFNSFAQKSDGSTKSLLNAEKDFQKSLTKNGEKDAYLDFSSADALVFKPNPTNAKKFYLDGNQSNEDLIRKPNMAMSSRSGDFGFTTGSYALGSTNAQYGQYLSIWKTDNEKWKLAMDLETKSNKPLNDVENKFMEPKDHFVPKFINDKEIKAGKDIIVTTEKTLNTLLKTHGVVAFSGFLAPNARLIFPGREAMNGEAEIVSFYSNTVDKITFKNAGVDKALGSDLAYTYGIATIDYKADLRESFNYVFVWQRSADFSWNLLVQAYVPAER